MPVVCSGSVAYDYILTFKGRFADHILPEKAHILNLSFLVDSMVKRKGGVAGNYAYSFQLLGYPSAVLATAGDDGADYRAFLEGLGVDCRGLRLLEGEHTASGFSTVDLDHNGIWGYYGGAMNQAAILGLDDTVPNPEAVIIGPNAPDAMFRLVGECRERGVPFIFDPAHQLPHLTKQHLEDCAQGAWILIGNDYELELIQERTGRDVNGLLELSEMVVTTLGADGSRIRTRDREVRIPTAAAREVVDPTGAGDAYRAGLVSGLLRGLPPERAGRIAGLAGTYAVEQPGTMEHHYTREEFAARYREAFGEDLP